MLQNIRDKAQGWIAWFIVILISVPFALWGIQSYLGGGSEQIVATVNGQEITERDFENGYRGMRQRLREQLGENYRPELIDETRLRREYLDSMIRNQLILQAARDMGLGAGDEQIRATIRSIPAFQVGGGFNKQAYERGVRGRGLTPSGFEAQIRQAIVSEQLSKVIIGSEFTTALELEQFVRLRMQHRDLDYLRIPAKNYTDAVDVSEQDARNYYTARQAEFMAPERVKVEYLELDIATISETLSADEESLIGYYEQNKKTYVVPEQRRASHILITLDESDDDAARERGLKLAETALERVRAGEDFAQVAAELSQDPGSADQGGDLGFFGKEVMEQVFEEAVFAMSEGDVSEPVRSQFGFHIIKLTAIRPESGEPFDAVREKIRAAYLKNEAERLFYEYAERMNDLAYEDPDSLQPAADALGIETRESDWLDREGGTGLFASTKLVGAAFSDDVLLERHNSEAVEIGSEHIAVLRVTEHEVAAVRPFDRVREQILSALKTEKAASLAQDKGNQLIEELGQGVAVDLLAGKEGLELISREGVGRDEREMPQALVSRLFKMPRPAGEKPVYAGVRLPDGDYAVIVLNKVEDGTLDTVGELGGEATLKSMIERSRGEVYFRHLVQNLRDQADIVISNQEESP